MDGALWPGWHRVAASGHNARLSAPRFLVPIALQLYSGTGNSQGARLGPRVPHGDGAWRPPGPGAVTRPA